MVLRRALRSAGVLVRTRPRRLHRPFGRLVDPGLLVPLGVRRSRLHPPRRVVNRGVDGDFEPEAFRESASGRSWNAKTTSGGAWIRVRFSKTGTRLAYKPDSAALKGLTWGGFGAFMAGVPEDPA